MRPAGPSGGSCSALLLSSLAQLSCSALVVSRWAAAGAVPGRPTAVGRHAPGRVRRGRRSRATGEGPAAPVQHGGPVTGGEVFLGGARGGRADREDAGAEPGRDVRSGRTRGALRGLGGRGRRCPVRAWRTRTAVPCAHRLSPPAGTSGRAETQSVQHGVGGGANGDGGAMCHRPSQPSRDLRPGGTGSALRRQRRRGKREQPCAVPTGGRPRPGPHGRGRRGAPCAAPRTGRAGTVMRRGHPAVPGARTSSPGGDAECPRPRRSVPPVPGR
jgi:hypothetical protein